MARDPDTNPLYNKEEDRFVENMLDHADRRSTGPIQPNYVADRAAFIDDLDKRMRRADWYYDYSEDISVWRKGFAEIKGIKDDLHTLSAQPNGWPAARQLWEQHTRPDMGPMPKFLQMPPEQNKELSRAPAATGKIENKLIGYDQQQPSSSMYGKRMKIEGKEAINVQSQLAADLAKGYHYLIVAPEKESIRSAGSFVSFERKADADFAARFLRQRDGKAYLILPIAMVQQELSRALDLQKATHPIRQTPYDVHIDAEMLLKQATRRMDLFKEHLERQLVDQGHPPGLIGDVKQLIGKEPLLFEVDNNRRNSAFDIKQFLQKETQAGNRFVVFLEDNALNKKELTVFRSAFDAAEFAYKNTTDKALYTALSITSMERKMDQLLGLGRVDDLQAPKDNQRAKDNGLSR